MRNTKETGDTAVAGVLASLLKKGYAILLPFGDSQRYDLVLDKEGLFFRSQCKNGSVKNDCIRFNTSSTEWYKVHRRKNYKEQVDYFGIYCPELDKSYLVPVNSIGETQGVLRLTPPKNESPRTNSPRFLNRNDFFSPSLRFGLAFIRGLKSPRLICQRK